MKKSKLNKKKLIISIILIVIIIISLLLIFKLKSKKNPFLGSWVSEGGTIYEFKENNEGVMTVPLSDYKFTYEIKDNILEVDFENDKATDTNYKYSFEKNKNKCVLTSDRGIFVFTKK